MHTINAPASQVDSQGRTWTFHCRLLRVDGDVHATASGNVNSNPSGLQFTVDGVPCATPCAVSRASGASIQVIAPAAILSSPVSRINFVSWSDGSTASTRSVTFNQNSQNFVATYQSQWALVATANPSGSASFTYSPATPDGFLVDGTQVTVIVVPANGFKFEKWSGDFSGTFTTGYLTMSGPRAITANTLAVPSIAPAGIMSAAGTTHDGTMAPGSVISIYGTSLSPALTIANTNPLPQTLGNVTVTIGNYLLPLLFVSPGQINGMSPVN